MATVTQPMFRMKDNPTVCFCRDCVGYLNKQNRRKLEVVPAGEAAAKCYECGFDATTGQGGYR